MDVLLIILKIIGVIGTPIILCSFCVFRPETNSVYAIMAGSDFKKFVGFPRKKLVNGTWEERRVNPLTGDYMLLSEYKNAGFKTYRLYYFWRYIGFMWVGVPFFRKLYTHKETYKETRIKPHTSNNDTLIEYETIDVVIETKALPRQETLTITFFGKTEDNAFIEVYLTVICNVTNFWKFYFRKKNQRSEARDTIYTQIKEFCADKHDVSGSPDFEKGYQYVYAQKTEGLDVPSCRALSDADVKANGSHPHKALYHFIVKDKELEDDFGLDVVNVNFPYIGPMLDLLNALQQETIVEAEGKAVLKKAEYAKKATITESEGEAEKITNIKTAENNMEKILLKIRATGQQQFMAAMVKKGVSADRAALAWGIANHEGGLALDSNAMLNVSN